MTFLDFNTLLDTHINASEKIVIKKKTKKMKHSNAENDIVNGDIVTPSNEASNEVNNIVNNIVKTENICHSYKTLEYRTYSHNKYKKNRTKKLECEIIDNFEDLEKKISTENDASTPKTWNKVDKHVQNKLIKEFMNTIVEKGNLTYENVKKKVDIALFTGKKVLYDNENYNIIGFKDVEF